MTQGAQTAQGISAADRARLGQSLTFKRGAVMKNRFMLAPLTNMQSNPDGSLSDDEYRWLTMRAKGGFAATMTCAAAVQANGQGWPGELSVFSENHLAGLKRLSSGIKAENSLSLVQLFHGGLRADPKVTATERVSASDHAKSGARALTEAEVETAIDDFVLAAQRSKQAGFDGIELHGAHGYLIAQFLSPSYNTRSDRFGGDLDGRSLFLRTIIERVRTQCGDDFILGLRLSAERFGLQMSEMLPLARDLMADGKIDFLDMSLWDCFKTPEEEAYNGKPLIDWYTDLERNGVPLGVAGKIYTPLDAVRALDAGADFVLPGRGAILNHDFARQAIENPGFVPNSPPVKSDTLRTEGLGEVFIDYLRTWDGFIAD